MTIHQTPSSTSSVPSPTSLTWRAAGPAAWVAHSSTGRPIAIIRRRWSQGFDIVFADGRTLPTETSLESAKGAVAYDWAR